MPQIVRTDKCTVKDPCYRGGSHILMTLSRGYSQSMSREDFEGYEPQVGDVIHVTYEVERNGQDEVTFRTKSAENRKETVDSDDHDPVHHPQHYCQGDVETIDFIRSIGREVFRGYCIGCAIKYLSRYPMKDGLEGVRKALRYIEYEAKENGTTYDKKAFECDGVDEYMKSLSLSDPILRGSAIKRLHSYGKWHGAFTDELKIAWEIVSRLIQHLEGDAK